MEVFRRLNEREVVNHQANLLDSLAIPLHRGLCGVVVAGGVAGAEGVVEGNRLGTATGLQYGEPPVVISSLIAPVLDSRKTN